MQTRRAFVNSRRNLPSDKYILADGHLLTHRLSTQQKTRFSEATLCQDSGWLKVRKRMVLAMVIIKYVLSEQNVCTSVVAAVGLNLKTVSISIIIKYFIMLFLSSLNAILQWRMSGVYLQSLALSEEGNRELARQQHSSTEEVLRK